ncbi:MAG: helix-turn-helix transcriptional regulator [Thermoplasmatales archaeon]|nr:MAG: helix-turn-helix transcriptional regulator [Thermoplasmatales archaeon]
MKLTTEHSASSYGMPIFLDDNDNVLDYADGIRRLRKLKKISTKKLGEICGVSHRTVEGWEQGRLPSKSALFLMKSLLSDK